MSYSIREISKKINHDYSWVKIRLEYMNIEPILKTNKGSYYDESVIEKLLNCDYQKKKKSSGYKHKVDNRFLSPIQIGKLINHTSDWVNYRIKLLNIKPSLEKGTSNRNLKYYDISIIDKILSVSDDTIYELSHPKKSKESVLKQFNTLDDDLSKNNLMRLSNLNKELSVLSIKNLLKNKFNLIKYKSVYCINICDIDKANIIIKEYLKNKNTETDVELHKKYKNFSYSLLYKCIKYLNIKTKKFNNKVFISQKDDAILNKFLNSNHRVIFLNETLKNNPRIVSKETIDKQRKTMMEKYGTKTPKFFYKYDDISFDSSQELYFYIYQKEILKNKICRSKIITYESFDGMHRYECDFFINEHFFEIKGKHFRKDNKLFYPYKKNKEYYNKIYSDKWKCMLRNKVHVIWTDSLEMKHIMNVVNKKYTKDYVSLFRLKLEFPYLNKNLKDKSDMGLIHHFHKSIYDGSRKGKLSPKKAWQDKNIVKKVALNRLKYVGKCKPSDILQGFNVTRIANKLSVFKPKLAENLLKKYCTTNNVFDPFSGFSGRMIGSTNLNKSYFGQDINSEHVKESNEIIKYKNYKNCNVITQDILTDQNKTLLNSTLFTCPPYGGKEHWNENNDEIEKSCDEWIDICIEKYKCKEYIFVVDETEKYKDYIVETIENKSHFGTNYEYVVFM